MSFRDQVIVFYLAGCGVLLGLAIQHNKTLFLIIPMMQLPAAVYWSYADAAIAKVAYHLRKEIEPRLGLTWEETRRKERLEKRESSKDVDIRLGEVERILFILKKLKFFLFGSRFSEATAVLFFGLSSLSAIMLFIVDPISPKLAEQKTSISLFYWLWIIADVLALILGRWAVHRRFVIEEKADIVD